MLSNGILSSTKKIGGVEQDQGLERAPDHGNCDSDGRGTCCYHDAGNAGPQNVAGGV